MLEGNGSVTCVSPLKELSRFAALDEDMARQTFSVGE
jgi:hypothetical protein